MSLLKVDEIQKLDGSNLIESVQAVSLSQAYEFDTVALMTASVIAFPVGKVLETKGYYTKGDAGAARYLIVAAQVVNGYSDHILSNGNIALLQCSGGSASKHIKLESWGCDTTGITDSTLPFTAALTSAMEGGSVMVGGAGSTIKITSEIIVQVSNAVSNIELRGEGTTLALSGGGGVTIEAIGTGLIRKLDVKGFRTTGGTTPFKFIAKSDLNFIFNLTVEKLSLNSFTGNGIELTGNVFEAALLYNAGSAGSSTGYGILLQNHADGGIVSSLDIYGGTFRGGLHGLYVASPVNDLRIYGGTYLFAEEEGVKILSAVGAAVYGVHVEGNWNSAPSLSAGGAGLRMDGSGIISGVFGITNATQGQKYVVRTFSSDVTITGGAKQGDTVKYGYYQTNTGASLVLVGEAANDYDSPAEVFPTTIGSTIKAMNTSMTENFRGSSTTTSIDMNRGGFVRMDTLVGNTTISNPTNPPSGNGVQLVIVVKQGATAYTVTFDTVFSASSSVAATTYTNSVWTFIRDGNKWREVSFASSPT